MNGPVTVYLPATGEIVAYGSIDLNAGDTINYPGGMHVPGLFDPATHYVTVATDPGDDEYWVPHMTGVLRPTMPATIDRTEIAADGVDEAVISDLPEGAEVSVDGGAWVAVEDTSVEFAADVAGTYKIRVRAWPHIEVSFEVIAA